MTVKERIKKIPGIMKLRGIQLTFRAPLYVRMKSRKDLKQYKNKYRGQRCFIIGNGPSLTMEDLTKLKDEYTFAANGIYLSFDKTEWRPTFYCIQDLHVLLNMDIDKLNEGLKSAKASFIRMQFYKNMRANNINIEKCIYIPITNTWRKREGTLFTEKADKFLYDALNVTYMSMQLAAYMGFSRIYLIGVDNVYPYNRGKDGQIVEVDSKLKSHFYDGMKGAFLKDVKGGYREYANASYLEGKWCISILQCYKRR
jgi:hypothetical protein